MLKKIKKIRAKSTLIYLAALFFGLLFLSSAVKGAPDQSGKTAISALDISITSFTASPTSVQPIIQNSHLSWVAVDNSLIPPSGAGITCALSLNGTNLAKDRLAVSGFNVNPFATSTYILTCTKGEQIVTASVEVKVIPSLVIALDPLSARPSSGITFEIRDSNGNLYTAPPYPYSLTSPSWKTTILNIPIGLYYITFYSIPGYTTPEPDSIIANDDWGNSNPHPGYPAYQQGRRFRIIDGKINTMNITYRKESTLKQLGRTTAETLLFTSPGAYKNRDWDLLRGVASVSTDGGVNWQSSVAEILSIGTMAQVTIVKDGSHYVVAGDSATYSMRFHAEGTKDTTYAATITDTITVSKNNGVSQDYLVTAPSATITPNSIDPLCPITSIIGTVDKSDSKKIIFNITTAVSNCEYEVKVKLNFKSNIASNTVVTDTADIVLAEGGSNSDTFTTLAIGSFTQETAGGDIYAKGMLNFGKLPIGQYGGKYILGADENIQTTSASKQGWTLNGYEIRSGSTSELSADACATPGSACKAMSDNIIRLKKGADTSTLFNGSIPSGNGSFDLNPNGIPEGGVFYKKDGNLNIGSGTGFGSVNFKGKGTIIVENGNVTIKNDLKPADSNSILGIIVKNGNVIISPSVGEVNAIFYIYSDKVPNGTKGSFIVNPDPLGEDKQLIIRGAVIASGKSILNGFTHKYERREAFILGRKYVGDPFKINELLASGKSLEDIDTELNVLLQPAEWFQYDSRIIVMPPPGFAGKIAGSL